MQFRQLPHFLAVVGMATASPAVQNTRALQFDDVVLLNSDGTSKIVKESEYNNLVSRGLIPNPAQAIEARTVEGRRSSDKNRRCEESTEIQVASDTTFLNWDVALSPVVSAAGGSASVSVEDGYSISNTLTVGTSASAGFEDFFSTTLSIDYSESWTSSQTTTLSYTVPDGQFGVVVSQPKTRRVTGTVLSGCTDSPTSQDFTSDSYTSQSYGSLAWVTGVIRLCNSTTYPIPYCIGSGSHS